MKRDYIINVLKRLHCTDEDIQRLIGDFKDEPKYIVMIYDDPEGLGGPEQVTDETFNTLLKAVSFVRNHMNVYEKYLPHMFIVEYHDWYDRDALPVEEYIKLPPPKVYGYWTEYNTFKSLEKDPLGLYVYYDQKYKNMNEEDKFIIIHQNLSISDYAKVLCTDSRGINKFAEVRNWDNNPPVKEFDTVESAKTYVEKTIALSYQLLSIFIVKKREWGLFNHGVKTNNNFVYCYWEKENGIIKSYIIENVPYYQYLDYKSKKNEEDWDL